MDDLDNNLELFGLMKLPLLNKLLPLQEVIYEFYFLYILIHLIIIIFQAEHKNNFKLRLLLLFTYELLLYIDCLFFIKLSKIILYLHLII